MGKFSGTAGGLRPLAAVVALAVLAGCGGSSGGASAPADAAPQSGSGSTKSAWTTLGSRTTQSAPESAIGTNGGARWVDYDPAPLYPKTVTLNNQIITMPDGVQLAASVTLPADASGNAVNQRFPVILTQTGYNKDIGAYEPALGGADAYLVQHGYAHVVVDVRGTGRSEGEWEAFGATEQSDYPHTVDWAASQPWSDGRVGLYGASLLAITALLTAEQQQPALKAAFPIVPMADGYRDIVFTGGQVNVGFIPLWLALVTGLSAVDPSILTDPAEGMQAELQHVEGAVANFQVPILLRSLIGDPSLAYDGDFWGLRSPVDKIARVKVPTFIVGGLHDIFQRGEPLLYEALKTRAPAKLLIGPWTHVQAAMGQGLPADGVPVLDHIALQWFDQYEKGMQAGADKQPNVTQYVYGKNHFVTATDWPNPQAQAQRLYLRGDRSLSAAAPAAGEASNAVLQQPLEGICSESTAQWTAGLIGLLPLPTLPCFTDDNLAEALDVKYETAPMTQELYFNGPLLADVWISTTAADAGVSVRVDDVDASGKAFALTNGILTASMRQVDTGRSRYLDGQLIQPWQTYTQAARQSVGSGNLVELQVEIFPTSALIQAGHRLRVAVGASDFPHGLPPLPDLLVSAAGVLTIHSDAAHPSSVVLPAVPASALQ